MLRDNLALLMRLYVRPFAAASGIIDEGRLFFALFAAIITALLLHAPDYLTLGRALSDIRPPAAVQQQAPSPEVDRSDPPPQNAVFANGIARFLSYQPMSTFSALWTIGVLIGPAVILLRVLLSHSGSFSVLMRSDYLPLLLCLLMCWTAAYLPLAVASAVTGGIRLPVLYAISGAYFLALAAGSIRTLFGQSLLWASGVTLGATVIGVGAMTLFSVMRLPFYYLASPFFLYYAYMFFGSDVRALGDGLRSRQSLRRQLEIGTTNPRDADAHYQLGLIYQKRRQYTQATAAFQRAVKVDPGEADAHYQLARIAREQNRLEDCVQFAQTAAKIDDKHSSNEVWRELGFGLLQSNRYEEAAQAFEKYTTRRAYDPEGLVGYGRTLIALDRREEAREMLERAIEAVRTMPPHRRGEVRRWGSAAESELRSLRS
jgi:tetratricopeptide (TPR) repeat protein